MRRPAAMLHTFGDVEEYRFRSAGTGCIDQMQDAVIDLWLHRSVGRDCCCSRASARTNGVRMARALPRRVRAPRCHMEAYGHRQIDPEVRVVQHRYKETTNHVSNKGSVEAVGHAIHERR